MYMPRPSSSRVVNKLQNCAKCHTVRNGGRSPSLAFSVFSITSTKRHSLHQRIMTCNVYQALDSLCFLIHIETPPDSNDSDCVKTVWQQLRHRGARLQQRRGLNKESHPSDLKTVKRVPHTASHAGMGGDPKLGTPYMHTRAGTVMLH